MSFQARITVGLIPITIAMTVCFAGCFNVKTFELKDNLQKALEESKRPEDQPRRVDRHLKVALVDPGTMGCVTVGSKEPELGSIACPMQRLGAEAEEELKDKAAELSHKGLGLLVPDLAPALLQILRRRLSQRFSRVSVRLVQQPQAVPGELQVSLSAMTYYQGSGELSEKHVLATLAAAAPGSQQVVVSGHSKFESSWGHMAWIIPVALALFPIGILPGSLFISSKQHAEVTMSILLSVDHASANLARRLATAHAPAR